MCTLLVNTLKVSFSPSVYLSLCLQVPTGSVRLFIGSVRLFIRLFIVSVTGSRIFASRSLRTAAPEGPIEGTPNVPNLNMESRVLTHSR
jgi:hypothetical protein